MSSALVPLTGEASRSSLDLRLGLSVRRLGHERAGVGGDLVALLGRQHIRVAAGEGNDQHQGKYLLRSHDRQLSWKGLRY
jgi:hypothetical protein